jgi:hypothetical protein
MSDWQRTASSVEHNDALECGFYDLQLSALPVTDESDRMGNGLMYLIDCQDFFGNALACMYEE